MILVFIDETQDSKFKDYLGLCCVVINSNFYTKIKTDFQNILNNSNWDVKEEFKGSFIFSTNRGCEKVSIEQRIEIASQIIKLNTSQKYSRVKVNYVSTDTNNVKKTYLGLLPKLLDKSISKPPKKKATGKDILAIYCDQRSDISYEEIHNVVKGIIKKKRYTLLENIISSKSGFETVGILYADIVGYLLSRIDTISNDAELFKNIPKEQIQNNGKVKKLKSSLELINMIKSSKLYKAIQKE